MATRLTAHSSDCAATTYLITSAARGDVEAEMAAVRLSVRPARVAFHGPFMRNGMFVAEGSSRDYAEGGE